ncbi:MAG: hypothetical protein ACTS10_19620 [Kiloniellales bacterium]
MPLAPAHLLQTCHSVPTVRWHQREGRQPGKDYAVIPFLKIALPVFVIGFIAGNAF